jgi:hypothetical protein
MAFQNYADKNAGWIGVCNCIDENPVEQELVVSFDGKSL